MQIQVIKCPNCGKEYLPSEIFIPDYLIGKPRTIVREGKEIISADGILPDMQEEFFCDDCNTKFEVVAKISYVTKANDQDMYNNEYISEYNKRYLLDES